jgi:uncharacterized protein (TIGR03118 family)
MKNLRGSSLARDLITVLVALAGCQNMVHAGIFMTTNLVSDDQTANTAHVTDPHLVNVWGISSGPNSPFWVSSNGAGVTTLYSVNPPTNATTKVGLEVSIPGDGSVTGQAFNGTTAFNSDQFIFVSEDGTISGWRGALGTTAEVLQSPSPDAYYKGVTLATSGGNTYLYAANFHTGNIDVLKGTPGAADLTGNFTDPNLKAGYAPFNIQLLGGKLHVAYAKQGLGKDEQAGAGLGMVDAFDTQGNFLSRVGTMGSLNAPWGLAIAPNSFGSFADDLLVGNFGDGTISAFNLSTSTFDGQLSGPTGNPVVIDGLWGLTVGNGTSAGNANTIYFSAGPADESHGLFGAIAPVPEPSSFLIAVTLCGEFSLVCVGRHLKRQNRDDGEPNHPTWRAQDAF